jgi:outer membrane translocation and assembly module TamA
VFGRRLVSANVEWRGWRTTARGLVRIAPAVFLDVARATRGFEGTNDRWQADAGAGVRFAVPGSGVVRVDLAHGLRDGGFVFSAGWTR